MICNIVKINKTFLGLILAKKFVLAGKKKLPFGMCLVSGHKKKGLEIKQWYELFHFVSLFINKCQVFGQISIMMDGNVHLQLK